MALISLLFALALTTAAPPADSGEVLCAPQLQIEQPAACPALGPGRYAAEFANAYVPAAVPALPLAPLERYDPVVDFKYAKVLTPEAPVFASPADGVNNIVARSLGTGFIYVNLVELVEEAGQPFYRIRTGEYLRAADVGAVEVTKFQGMLFNDEPVLPIAWIVSSVRPSARPGQAAPEFGPRLVRKSVVQIFATVRVGEWDWYLIGPNTWVEQRAVSRLNLNPPPPGVTGKWIQVDLFEQTLAAYEGAR